VSTIIVTRLTWIADRFRQLEPRSSRAAPSVGKLKLGIGGAHPVPEGTRRRYGAPSYVIAVSYCARGAINSECDREDTDERALALISSPHR